MPSSAKGFFTDTTLCIGCKACEVACKQWNQLPEDGLTFTGRSYDNTGALGPSTWRHVAFVERTNDDGQLSWLMMSDVCKHCTRAGCLEACPTGAILRTEHGSVYIQPDVCNGCGYCVASCPFGVVDRLDQDGRAFKCTLCYDRLQGDLEPACAKACPTDSILFGDVGELRARAEARVNELKAHGVAGARLYGADAESQPGTEGLNAFFLLVDEPEVYNLPPDPVAPAKKAKASWAAMAVAAVAVGAAAVLSVRSTRHGVFR
ncbi:Formate dehydrogenase O beta subunit protein [Minicystis rosea]|nr:Formate dehydrogenase O beta subunit protein [Minicystis rosea]